MNKYNDEILRISAELSLFMSEFGRTINEVAEVLNISKRIVREDVYNLLTNDKVRGLLVFKESDNMEDHESDLQEAVLELFESKDRADGKNRLKKNREIKGTTEKGINMGKTKDGSGYGISSGAYDDTRFTVNRSFLNYSEALCDDEEYMLVLSGDDYSHLDEFLLSRGKNLKKMDSLFRVKNSIEMTKSDAGLKYDLMKAIQFGECIKFRYKDSKVETYEIKKVKPVKVCYNSDSGFMYLIDSDNYSYRFDRIEGRTFSYLGKSEQIDKKEKVYDKMIDVKVLIPKKDGYNNLIDKIKEDVTRRSPDINYNPEEHFIEEPDRYIYIDRVKEAGFQNWVYSYGYSMVVEEPADIRKKIIESYKARAEYYSDVNE